MSEELPTNEVYSTAIIESSEDAILTTRDSSEPKRLARAVAAQQHWFRVTLESIGDAVVASDLEGRVTFVNAEAAALTGWSTEEAVGCALTDVFPVISETTGTPVEDPVAQVIRSGRVHRHANHTALIRRDGTRRPVACSAAPIRDDAGQVIGVVRVFRDMTEERKAEAAVIAANRNKDEFLAVLAHELRNPLAPIITAVELLEKKGPPTKELQHVRDVIHRQATLLARLIDDLLDVRRVVGGKLTVERERVDVNQIVKQATEMCLPAVEQRGQTLELALSDAPVHIDGDYTRLVEAFGNILGNASKYTDEGGRIVLTLCTERDSVVIRVRDNGLGISPDMLERIFDRFVRIDSDAHRSRRGFGIGLALVKAIVDLHGGTVEARSEGFGTGSEFVIRLPLAVAPAPKQ